MPQKPDMIITEARYRKDGDLLIARLYERRGAAYSDHVLMDRDTLSSLLQKKKRAFTGQRQEFMAGTFTTGKEIKLLANGKISTDPNAVADTLDNVPLF